MDIHDFHWLRDLELRETIIRIADDLLGIREWDLHEEKSQVRAEQVSERYSEW